MEVSGRRKEEDSDDHTTGILCEPCLGVNEEENAVFYCTVCNEFLCDIDAKKHRKAAISKSHPLLDRVSMPLQKIGSYKDNMCQFHSEKILEYYCNFHQTGCCTVCATKAHTQCEVEYIDDIVKGYEQSSEFKSLMKYMTDLMQCLYSVKQQSLDNKSNVQRIQSEIISDIRKFRVEINSILDSLESTSLEEVKRAVHVDSDATESTTAYCDALMVKLQQMTSTIEDLRKYKQERQLVMQSKEARVQVQEIEDQLSKLSCRFIPDKEITQLLRSLKSLGDLEITEERTKQKANEQRAKTGSGAEVFLPVINQPVTASHVRDINIEHSTDTSTHCAISGGVMLDQTKIVLADCINHSVKVVDFINNTVISCIKLPSPPRDITRVDQDQVVVSCDGGKLLFLKVGKMLSIVKQLDLDGDVWGITYTNNSLLVVFDYPDSCVKVMDLKGKTLKTIKTDTAENDRSYPHSNAFSENQNTMIVSDLYNDSVTSFHMDGTVRGVYTDDNLIYPVGLAVDRNDNVYVAGYDSQNIHQLSADCKPIQVLLDTEHGIDYPSMVTYCKTEHKLNIGYNSITGGHYISFFQLQ